LGLTSFFLMGCSGNSVDVAKERSPSATGPDVKSTGPAQLKVKMDKLQSVGQGDGVKVENGK